MQLAPEAFDPATVALMGRVCEGAWDEATNRLSLFSARDSTSLRNVLALRVMAAVANGERDPDRLRLMALAALDA
jgi:hypothetical protein